MAFITFPLISPISPTHLSTGVKTNKGFVFSVPLVVTDVPSNTYAYPDIAQMKSSGLFDQWNSNSDFTGGYGIVRKQITKATGVPAGQPAGLNNYPDDWKIAANFGSIIPCNIYYCDSEGNILTESAAVQEGTFRSKVWLLIKPVSNLDYNSDYSVILEPYLPYKQLQLTVAEEPIGGGEV